MVKWDGYETKMRIILNKRDGFGTGRPVPNPPHLAYLFIYFNEIWMRIILNK